MRRFYTLFISFLAATTVALGGKRVLFIGDSVTDGGWGNSAGSAKPAAQRNQWDKNHIFGHSYMMLCAAHYTSEQPQAGYDFINRGISGDDLQRLEARWQDDVVALRPDVLSMLVGTNDVHYYLAKPEGEFDVAQWERRYRALLDQARAANPDMRLVLGTPFVAKAGKTGKEKNFIVRDSLTKRLATAVQRIADDYGAVLLRYDSLFAAQRKASPSVAAEHWIWDGIHPTAAGHRLMADLWTERVDKAEAMKNPGERRVTISADSDILEQYPDGPFDADWQSIADNYEVPEWFKDAKFGIFIHWGVYSVPAAGSEWYPKHMYNGLQSAHRAKWGRQSQFGYKDFVPMFKAEEFNPQQWAELFREAGARYVIPTAEHHDGFAMYDSRLTEWNAKQKGPQRDIIGELGEAVRGLGMKYGVSNHRIENWDFMWPSLHADSTDLFLPEYAGLYGPPQMPTRHSGMGPTDGDKGQHPQSDAFLDEWQLRVMEIIDKYKPDLIYFDNGINYRSLDPWKLRIARYYYNSAAQWGKQVSIQSKGKAFLAGAIQDFERESRAPRKPYSRYWQVDDPIGNKFGYIENLKLQSAEGIIRNLVDNIACGGNLCLNISPKADGTIPEDQQAILRTIGQWLKRYGEAVYNTRTHTVFGEGRNIRYTRLGDNTVFAFAIRWDGKPFTLRDIDPKKVKEVTCLADGKKVKVQATADGLLIDKTLKVSDPAVAFRIELR